jgi:hypothetical protein
MGAPHCNLSDATTRDERLAAVNAHYTGGNENTLGGADHVVLVEEGSDGSYYVTLHLSLQDAADYHDTQEYPEESPIKELVVLDTGEQFFAVPHTTFERFPD